MAIPNLNFRGSIKSSGRFSSSQARKIIDDQFKGLSSAARIYMIKKIGSGKTIHATDFNEIVADAHKKGLMSRDHSEKLMDITNAPDNLNAHLK